MIEEIVIKTAGKGLTEFTHLVKEVVQRAHLSEGLCTVFVRHTSASLLIQENADPSAKRDLEAWMERHVPALDPLFTHIAEGEDDMPAHIKSALTQTSVGIPVLNGELALGTWQGIFLWEHRVWADDRRIIVHVA